MCREMHPEADDRRGVEPASMHECVPAYLQEAKPKAGSLAIQVATGARAPGRKDREADRRRERSPEANIDPSPIRHRLFSNTYAKRARRINPTKINRVGRRDAKACGPGCAEMQIHPPREQTCEGMNPRSAAGRRGKDQIVRPGRERPRGRVAERRARDHDGA
jgi:hypothetical protein